MSATDIAKIADLCSHNPDGGLWPLFWMTVAICITYVVMNWKLRK